jgi:enoyl-CoA hydratase/carnithine racemase
MIYQNINYETDERLAIITLNRPGRMNALSLALCREIVDAVAEAERDPAVRVIVVTGAGGRAFSAGYDLADGEDRDRPIKSVSDMDARLRIDFDFSMSVWNCPKPVIAMIEGHCLGGGLEFAQMCDVRYCSEDSSFGVVETRFSTGIVTMIMPWIMGPLCRELIYTGDIIGADEALRFGLVSRVFPKASLHEQVFKIARRMACVAGECLRWNKRAINGAYETQGLMGALQAGLNAATLMNSENSAEMTNFNNVLASEGLKAALEWRRKQFAAYE